MEIRVLKRGCVFGGKSYGPGIVELNVAELPPLWKGKAEIVDAKKKSKKKPAVSQKGDAETVKEN